MAPLQPKECTSYRSWFSHRPSEHRLIFDPTRSSKIVGKGIFVGSAICLSLVIVCAYLWLSGANINIRGYNPWVPIFAGAIFLQGGVIFGVIGFILKSKLAESIVFDRQVGGYWRGSTTLTDEDVVTLTDIHAVQIVKKWHEPSGRGDEFGANGYWSFQLNLVTTDGQRHNVVDHGDLEGLREDAESLRDFLQIPLWDATSD